MFFSIKIAFYRCQRCPPSFYPPKTSGFLTHFWRIFYLNIISKFLVLQKCRATVQPKRQSMPLSSLEKVTSTICMTASNSRFIYQPSVLYRLNNCFCFIYLPKTNLARLEMWRQLYALLLWPSPKEYLLHFPLYGYQ